MTYTIYNVVGYVLLALDKCKQEYKSKKMFLRLLTAEGTGGLYSM